MVGNSYKLSILFNAIASTLIQFTNIICTNDYNTFFSLPPYAFGNKTSDLLKIGKCLLFAFVYLIAN